MNIISAILGLIGVVAICTGIFLIFRKLIPLSIATISIGLLAVIFAESITYVPSGYVGIRTVYGQISERPSSNGINWNIPIIENIHNVNCKQQEINFGDGKIWSETSERTEVYCQNVVVDYQINAEFAAWIWTNVEEWDTNLVKRTSVESGIKTATKKFNDTDVTDRSKIEGAAKDAIQASINEKYGKQIVDIVSVTIGNINFSDAYNEAIEKKAQAKLAAETAEYTNKQKTQQIKTEAEQKKIQAQADAEAEKIAAEGKAEVVRINAEGKAEATRINAEAEAEANRMIADSLTQELIEMKKITKWDGSLPKVSAQDPLVVVDSVDFIEE